MAGGWTIFYWGWWISWAPFVGLFIARISRGRTLREFVFGALVGPTLFTLLWMTVFGNSAIELILSQGFDALAVAVQQDESVALFKFLDHFPLSELLSGFAVVMVMVFFITSADSGAMVLNMLSSNGRDDTPMMRRVFWMAMIGLTAMVLLLAGGLSALQTAAIASALPFSLAVLVAIWGFVRALSVDDAKRQAALLTTTAPTGGAVATDWKARLNNLLQFADASSVDGFIERQVDPAMETFAAELRLRGLDAQVESDGDNQRRALVVRHGDEVDFLYQVKRSGHLLPADALLGNDESDGAEYYRAEVYLNEGSQGYDLMGWTQDQVLHDLLEQYEKHLHFLHVVR